MKYPTIFHLVSAIFNKKAVTCVLIGGFAVNYHKVARTTSDVDFLTTKEAFEAVFDLLEKEGFSKFSEQDTFVQLKSDKDFAADLDFMFVDKDVLDKIVKDGQQAVIAGQKFIVPSVNHLIALKLHAIKFNKMREYEDLADIIDLIRANNIDIKSAEFKELCLKYGSEAIYKRILDYFLK